MVDSLKAGLGDAAIRLLTGKAEKTSPEKLLGRGGLTGSLSSRQPPANYSLQSKTHQLFVSAMFFFETAALKIFEKN